MLADFKYGTFQKRVKDLERLIYEQLDSLEDTGAMATNRIDPLDVKAGGHTLIKHVDPVRDDRLIERIINEGIDGAGYFMNARAAYDALYNAALYEADKIINWQMKSRNEFDSAKQHHRLKLSINLGTDVIGKSFFKENEKIVEMNCTSLTLVLQRNPQSPCGFMAVTAYPNRDNAFPTGREFTPKQIIDEKIYSFRSAVEKTAFLCSSYIQNISIDYQSYQGEDSIRFYGKKNGASYLAYVNDRGQMDISKQIHSEKGLIREEMSVNTLFAEFPSMQKSLIWAKDMIRGGEPVMDRFIEVKSAKSFEDMLAEAEQKRQKSTGGRAEMTKSDDFFRQ